jgi:hypothetical protein
VVKRQRQPGGEAEKRHNEHLALEIDRDGRGEAMKRLSQGG